MRFRFIALALLSVTATSCSGDVESTSNRNKLREIVSMQCVPDQIKSGKPAPCAEIDTAQGYAVLKNIKDGAEFMLIPTAQVTGIEDPALLDPKTPNYFAAAWTARHYTETALGKSLPRQDFALAVNAPGGRSQDQLHIHIECIRPDVRDALHDHIGEITETWAQFPVVLVGHNYFSRRVYGENLDGVNPFMLLANNIPIADKEMGQYTLAVAGEVFEDGRPGFVLLGERAETGHSAELLDHSCEVAQ